MKKTNSRSAMAARPAIQSEFTSGRRLFLRGVGGAMLGLPLLESLGGACVPPAERNEAGPFAIFMRQPAGVAAAQDTTELGGEPEHFWPRATGPLTRESVEGRALDELQAHLEKILVVGNVNNKLYEYGDGHANGAFQALTARGPLEGTSVPFVEASGESLDNFIARKLGGEGTRSLYLHAGAIVGWLGGACISHRTAGQRHAAERSPERAFFRIMGSPAPASGAEQSLQRRQLINDLVRGQMTQLMATPRLSAFDRTRLQDHFDAVRDVERRVSCESNGDLAAQLQEAAPSYESPNGDDLIRTVELHLEVAALAVACGVTRSVVLQIGDGNGGDLRFVDPDNQRLLENYHFISHRRVSHDVRSSVGEVISGADVLHHKIDRQFARMFKHLIDQLSSYTLLDGRTLLQSGVAAWYNDNGNGPGHCRLDTPWVLAGNANGFLKTGEFLHAEPRIADRSLRCRSSTSTGPNINRFLNTLATAVGVTKRDGSPTDNFGDPELEGGLLPALLAASG